MDFNSKIESLLDDSSFIEMGAFNKSSNIITGHGTIDGRLVYVYSQCGAVNSLHAKKMAMLYKKALTMGAPIIGFLDSKGLTVDDGLDVLEAYGEIFSLQSSASGVVPQISIVSGDCLGISTYMPFLSDFVIMSEEKAKLIMSSPQTLEGLEGKKATYESLGNAQKLEKNGLVHLVCKDESECIQSARELLGYIPSNNMENPPVATCNDNLNRESINTEDVVTSVVDNNKFFELKKGLSENLIIGFGRFAGYSTGIISISKTLELQTVEAITAFVKFCDAYNIPVLTFTGVSEYSKKVDEQQDIIKYCGKLLYTFSSATVPKINIITKDTAGSPYLILNSKHIGADIVYSWEDASISLLSKEASKVINTEENLSEAAEKGFVDDVIKPFTTRKRIIAALEMLSSKRVIKYPKKHGSLGDI